MVVRVADAVVLAGGRFGPAAGMLMYAGAVAERRDATVHRHCWSRQPPHPSEPHAEAWVHDEVGPLLDTVAGRPLLIGKSLGTIAASVAAERSLPAVWLTPLLTVPGVTAALSRATAPFLLVGGSGDAWWDGTSARQLSPHVLEIENADHGMYVPGPLVNSIDVLARMVTAVEHFIDEINWPG
jgi:hypothetical protein